MIIISLARPQTKETSTRIKTTRGIDIGAQALIWEKLRNSRDEGLSVLLISADLEELIGLSDRIIVFYQGKLVKELDAEKVTPEDLGGYMTGLKK